MSAALVRPLPAIDTILEGREFIVLTISVCPATIVCAGIIVYTIGIPAFAMYLLWRNRNRLDTAAFRRRYAFLYDGYDLTVRKGRSVRSPITKHAHL